MAFYNTASFKKSVLPAAADSRLMPLYFSPSSSFRNELRLRVGRMARPMQISRGWVGVYALDRNKSSSSSSDSKKGVPNSNYVVPLDISSSCITRPLVEILRDLNKKIPDNIVKPDDCLPIPWYHANRMLSFYAPGWCGEIRDVIFSDNGSVTVVYRVTIRGSDGEAHRESTGTVLPTDGHVDPVAAAEEIAFCRACARFGLGLYLYHGE